MLGKGPVLDRPLLFVFCAFRLFGAGDPGSVPGSASARLFPSSEHAYPEEKKPEKQRQEPLTVPLTSLIMAWVLAVGLFFLPSPGTDRIGPHFCSWTGEGLAFNAVDGLFRGLILFGLPWRFPLFPDIKFSSVITGRNTKSFMFSKPNEAWMWPQFRSSPPLHPRCGTPSCCLCWSAMLVFPIPADWGVPARGRPAAPDSLIAGAAYELIRFSARHLQSAWARFLVAPGSGYRKSPRVLRRQHGRGCPGRLPPCCRTEGGQVPVG